MTIVLAQVFLVVLLTLVNGLFAASEAALISSREERLGDRAEREDDAGARAALRLLSNPNRFLSTVQIGISLVGVSAGAVGGASLSEPLAGLFSNLPVVGPYAGTVSFFVVVGAITYLSLIIGELVPKRLALAAPERFASLAARPMGFISRLTAPVVWFLGVSTEAVLRLIPGGRAAEEPSISERELEIMLSTGAEEGVFEEDERDLVRRALRLDDRPIREIMTPRLSVVWLDAAASANEHREIALNSGFSRFPVARGSLDDLIGVASTRAAFERAMVGESPDLLPPQDLENSLYKPAFVFEGAPVASSVEAFRRSGLRMAVVVDERGNFEGLVTMHDVFRVLFGPPPDSSNGEPANEPETTSERGGESRDERGISERDDGSLMIDGLLPVSAMKERLALKRLPNEEDDYQTVGGMVLSFLRDLPSEGESFEWEGWTFEVVSLDNYRVERVLATRTESREESPPEDP